MKTTNITSTRYALLDRNSGRYVRIDFVWRYHRDREGEPAICRYYLQDRPATFHKHSKHSLGNALAKLSLLPTMLESEITWQQSVIDLGNPSYDRDAIKYNQDMLDHLRGFKNLDLALVEITTETRVSQRIL